MMDEIERRIEELEHKVNGVCPECLQYIKNWKAPVGSFAPEAWATLRENGIDPSSGHGLRCMNQKLRLT